MSRNNHERKSPPRDCSVVINVADLSEWGIGNKLYLTLTTH